MKSSDEITIVNIEQGIDNGTYALPVDALLHNRKYRIASVLGKGGFGMTYKGLDTTTGQSVAIKEFFMKEYCERDGKTSTQVTIGTKGSRELVESYHQKFLKEAQIIRQLNHPNIIRIYDIFEENGTAYYVMDYIEGGSLKDAVEVQGAFTEKAALGYIRKIGQALSYIHSKKILHLDIKPSNILLHQGEPVLIDFGISKRYDNTGQQTSSTPVGISKGFAPMEQYSQGGVKQFEPSTDIYSLGATLFFLLTGKTPPEATIVNEDGLPPLPGKISGSTASAIRKAMQPKRKDRPQSVTEFLGQLKSARPIPHKPPRREATDKEVKSTIKKLILIPLLAPLLLALEYYIAEAIFQSDAVTAVLLGVTLPLARVVMKRKEDYALSLSIIWTDLVKAFFCNLMLFAIVAGVCAAIIGHYFYDYLIEATDNEYVTMIFCLYVSAFLGIVAMEIAVLIDDETF